MKQCGDCGEYRSSDEFNRNASRPDGRQGQCRKCQKARAQARDWAKSGPRKSGNKPDRQRAYRRFWRYGMTPCEYAKMRISQGDRCAICLTEPAEHIDHCHDTGVVRGLLCGGCNRGLGQFKDDVERLRSALEYLTH